MFVWCVYTCNRNKTIPARGKPKRSRAKYPDEPVNKQMFIRNIHTSIIVLRCEIKGGPHLTSRLKFAQRKPRFIPARENNKKTCNTNVPSEGRVYHRLREPTLSDPEMEVNGPGNPPPAGGPADSPSAAGCRA